jgi:hypothetical protein
MVAGAMLTGAYCLFHRRLRTTWGLTFGTLGGVAGVGVGLYLFISQLGYPYEERLILWSLVVLSSVLAVMLLPKNRPIPADHDASIPSETTSLPVRRWSTLTKALASLGISAGLVWGIVQFWYSNQYVPSTLGAALVISPNLKEVGRLEDMRLFTAEVKVRNTSNTKVRALTSLYKVEALSNKQLVKDEANFFSEFNPAERNRALSRLRDESREDVIQFGKLMDDNWYFEPGEEYITQFLIYAPNDGYISLRLTADIVMAKGSRLILGDKPRDSIALAITPDDAHRYSLRLSILEWPLKQVSNIRSLTTGRHELDIVTYLVGRDEQSQTKISGLPGLSVCIDQANRALQAIAKADPKNVCQAKETYREELHSFYGMIRTSTVYEVSIQKGENANSTELDTQKP